MVASIKGLNPAFAKIAFFIVKPKAAIAMLNKKLSRRIIHGMLVDRSSEGKIDEIPTAPKKPRAK